MWARLLLVGGYYVVGLNLPAIDAQYKPTIVPTNEPRMNVDPLIPFCL